MARAKASCASISGLGSAFASRLPYSIENVWAGSGSGTAASVDAAGDSGSASLTSATVKEAVSSLWGSGAAISSTGAIISGGSISGIAVTGDGSSFVGVSGKSCFSSTGCGGSTFIAIRLRASERRRSLAMNPSFARVPCFGRTITIEFSGSSASCGTGCAAIAADSPVK